MVEFLTFMVETERLASMIEAMLTFIFAAANMSSITTRSGPDGFSIVKQFLSVGMRLLSYDGLKDAFKLRGVVLEIRDDVGDGLKLGADNVRLWVLFCR